MCGLTLKVALKWRDFHIENIIAGMLIGGLKIQGGIKIEGS